MPNLVIKVKVGGQEVPTVKKLAKVTAFETCLVAIKADRNLKTLVALKLKPFKISLMQWLLMGVVNADDGQGINTRACAEMMGVSLAHITALSSELVVSKLLRQRTSRLDRRSRNLFLTAKGRSVFSRAEEAVNNALTGWLKSLPENQQVFYRRVVETMSRQL